jgi:hypothetical protein
MNRNSTITRSMLLDSFIHGRDIRLDFVQQDKDGYTGYQSTGVIISMERESGGAGYTCHNFNVTIVDHFNVRHTTFVRTMD